MEEEIWKVFYVGPRVKYEASTEGRIRRNGRIIDLGIKNGYYSCMNKYVHRIIAQLFIPNPENNPCIDHINTNKLDNRVENLRWVTYSENALNPITRQHQSIIMKEANSRPEVKAKQSAAQKEAQNRPEVKEKKSAAAKEANSRPEVKAKRSASMKAIQKEIQNRPEVKAKHSAAQKDKTHTLETKAKIGAAMRASWAKRKQKINYI